MKSGGPIVQPESSTPTTRQADQRMTSNRHARTARGARCFSSGSARARRETTATYGGPGLTHGPPRALPVTAEVSPLRQVTIFVLLSVALVASASDKPAVRWEP